jgi:hypothetical protein
VSAQPAPVQADGGPAVIRAIFDALDGPEAERRGQVEKQNGGSTIGHASLTLRSQPERFPTSDHSVSPASAAPR